MPTSEAYLEKPASMTYRTGASGQRPEEMCTPQISLKGLSLWLQPNPSHKELLHPPYA